MANPNLKQFLDNLLEEIPARERRDSDPVSLVWKTPDEEREVAGIIASSIAYGQVELVIRAARQILEACDYQPRRFALASSDHDLRNAFDGFVYRMTRGEDVADLFAGIRTALREHGSIENAYVAGREAHQDPVQSHVLAASRLVQTLRAGRIRPGLARGFQYLLPDPALGSTTKRLHLYFRWMARSSGSIDLGLWDSLEPRDLVMPLDTHTSRICRYLGLTDRKSNDLKAALEITRALRSMDPDDPLRYDFAICHLGISGRCIHEWSPEHCPACPIFQMCSISAEHR